ncbi:3-hydroxyacyl-ACP dehydratase [Bizionia gelidisalsuginis]|uniref:3-hydroxyacyl-ACP dehydratase n=2 Tax=Bizionia TaxID=283785 RepID=A0A8H2LE46_9FLAO|nr:MULTISPECIES: 3-hydroxyacyl-ACP dehydratase [Bizionia]TYB74103.1 3-hydroxyacyl-ACP dehydratase [Bizionia saleffrena]TYC15551.1 3-hydroxyacyl-ACP dehydratase [Bizionia gelidisalsuginis]
MLFSDFYTILDAHKTSAFSFGNCVELNKNHSIFSGHFPENPITPGVIMLQIIKNSLEQALQCNLKLQALSNLKFLQVVDPNRNNILHFQMDIKKENDIIKIKSSSSFPDHTLVLKCNATFVKY